LPRFGAAEYNQHSIEFDGDFVVLLERGVLAPRIARVRLDVGVLEAAVAQTRLIRHAVQGDTACEGMILYTGPQRSARANRSTASSVTA
jgi:hypothetical protein